MVRSVNDQVTCTTGEGAGSTYRVVRFPAEAKIKHVWVWLDGAVTTFDADLDLAWSDSTVDGTNIAYQGTIPQISSADNKFYGAAIDLHAVIHPTDYVFTPGGAAMNQPAWENMGYSKNPGGYLDLMLKVTSTATSGAAVVNAEVVYVI